MGLFQKNPASKLFSSSFAIENSEPEKKPEQKSEKSEESETIIKTGDAEADLDKTVGDVLSEDIAEGDFEPIEKGALVSTADDKDEESQQSLSISQVVQLVRSLPQQGTEVELHAVLRTLELFHIDVRMVLNDSHRKEAVTTTRIDTLLSEISTLDEEIDKRAKEIKMLEIGITEMARVNECLELMLKLDDELLEAEKQEEQALIEDLSIEAGEAENATNADAEQETTAVVDNKSDDVDADDDTDSENSTGETKSARERLDEYVKKGQTQTLDGIIIDLDSPPKKIKLTRKPKTSRRKTKRAVEEKA